MPTTTLRPHDIGSLERATLEAVCPTAQSELPGWLLPFDAADIGRARSAIPLRHQNLDIALLPAIEQQYRDHGLPPCFRIADTSGLRHWQERLKALGYRKTDPVHVQIASVADMQAAADSSTAAPRLGSASDRPKVMLLDAPAEAWASVYTATGFDAADGALRVQLLSRSRFARYAYVQNAGVSLAAGTACISRDWLSVHGMRTLPHARSQGLGASLLSAFVGMAWQRGVTRAFLQVEADNAPALGLYRRFGFTTAWTYHYWKAPA
jgi:GNAT superfamily N-acetyltransferase